jgi:lactate dehydrogenase-like 2-hydroxyacid dehydrogenase
MAVAVAPRAIITRRWPMPVRTAFESLCKATANDGDVPFTREQLEIAMRSATILVPTVTDQIDAELLRMPDCRVKLIANIGVGVNHIDLEAARAAGIVVTNTPDVLTNDTADVAISLMLMAARRLGEGERLLRSGLWAGWAPTQLLGRSLHGSTLGIVGYGRIGRAVARRAQAFGMTVQAIGHPSRPAVPEPGVHMAKSLDDLLTSSDFVSLHAPATRETRNLIGRDQLARMRTGSILVNTARGSLVDESALVDALRHGPIAAAGLDVYELEPLVHPMLRALENVVLLPHLGSATRDARTAMGLRASDNARAWLSGGVPLDRVA